MAVTPREMLLSLGKKAHEISRGMKELLGIFTVLAKFKKQRQTSNKLGNLRFSEVRFLE